jgi:ABC-type sugar transport system ATPase subunit
VGEAERLQAIIRRLASEGVAIVYISHRMEEIFEIARAVTVSRDALWSAPCPWRKPPAPT